MESLCHPALRCALCHPAPDAGFSIGESCCCERVHKRTFYYLVLVFLDTASQRGMTKRVTPHFDAGPRKCRWEIYLRNLLQELLDFASQCGMTSLLPVAVITSAFIGSGGGQPTEV